MLVFPAICRFCTNNSNLIYNLDDENSSLIGKLATLAPDTVEFNETLPQKICQSCYDKLNDTYKFQQQIYQVFKIYKTYAEHQQSLTPTAEGEPPNPTPFEYVDEDFLSDDLKQFFNSNGTATAKPKDPNAPKEPFVVKTNMNIVVAKPETKKATTRKPEASATVPVKRKRGRPRKYCGLMEFKNDDLTDVEKMKDAVVNSLPNIDPDYEPEPYYEEPLVINLRKKRGRPKSLARQEKENQVRRNNETFIITEQVHQVYDVVPPNEPGCSNQDPNTPKGKTKRVTRIGAIQSDVDPHEYTYQLPYDPNVTITYISNAAEKFFFCKTCNKQYCDFSSLRKHFVQHSAVKVFQCNVCRYETFAKHCLDLHLNVHADANASNATDATDAADATNATNATIAYDATNAIGAIGATDATDATNATDAINESASATAIATATAEPHPETCQECGKTFKSKDRLQRHNYCHMKRFICDMCGKEFSHSAMLKKHVQHIHINERNFFCSVCGFAAKSQEYLNRHMVRHDDSDENKIECTVCKKLLKTRNSFKIHMKRHEDDRSSETPYWRKAV